jgi:hypothetical protein
MMMCLDSPWGMGNVSRRTQTDEKGLPADDVNLFGQPADDEEMFRQSIGDMTVVGKHPRRCGSVQTI